MSAVISSWVKPRLARYRLRSVCSACLAACSAARFAACAYLRPASQGGQFALSPAMAFSALRDEGFIRMAVRALAAVPCRTAVMAARLRWRQIGRKPGSDLSNASKPLFLGELAPGKECHHVGVGVDHPRAVGQGTGQAAED